jgi:thiosulfate/3-mercaptopyruvate sulfurtransferase
MLIAPAFFLWSIYTDNFCGRQIMSNIAGKGIIEPADLAALLEQGKAPIKLIDATYSESGRDAWQKKRIGNAVFFDIDEISDHDNPMPHMLPYAVDFADAAEQLGISSSDTIVVYDQSGLAMAAARVWWTFRVFGHDNICVLNGGLPAWEAEGLPITKTTPEKPARGHFDAAFRPNLVRGMESVLKASKEGSCVILDARSAGRFAGTMPEPRPGLRAGHIPGSRNVPFVDILDPVNGKFKPANELEAYFNALDKDKNIIASCGSGVTACVLALALYSIGREAAVYDGSWAEWGQESSETPVAAAKN